MSKSPLHLRPSGTAGKVHSVTPQSAGWTYVGFDLYRLKPGRKGIGRNQRPRGLPRLGQWQGRRAGWRQGFRADRRAHEPVRRAAACSLYTRRLELVGDGGDGSGTRRLLGARRRCPRSAGDPARHAPGADAGQGHERPLRQQHHAGRRRRRPFAAGRRGDHARRHTPPPIRRTSTTRTTCRTKASSKRPTITASTRRRVSASSGSIRTTARSTRRWRWRTAT